MNGSDFRTEENRTLLQAYFLAFAFRDRTPNLVMTASVAEKPAEGVFAEFSKHKLIPMDSFRKRRILHIFRCVLLFVCFLVTLLYHLECGTKVYYPLCHYVHGQWHA